MSSAGLREHRRDGREQREREAREAGGAFAQRGARDRAEAAAYIAARRTSADRHAGRGRDRVDHHALERALAQLADQQADEELLLVGGRAREQAPQRLRAACRGAGAAHRRDVREAAVDVADREPGARRYRLPPSLRKAAYPMPKRPELSPDR